MRLIDADALLEVINRKIPCWWTGKDTDRAKYYANLVYYWAVKEMPTIDAIPLGVLELEKRDCSFADQCDMGSSYGRERERACKNIIEWWKTPSYQRCLQVALERGFVKKRWE